MGSLKYSRVIGEEQEELYLYFEGNINPLPFRLGSILLLVMKTLPLLGEQPSSTKYFYDTVKNACKELDGSEILFHSYLWPLYEGLYDEKDPLVWLRNERMLSTIYTYIELCMDKPEHYDEKDFLVLASEIVKDFSPPTLVTNPHVLDYGQDVHSTKKTERSQLESLFQNKEKYKPTYMYEVRCLEHVCLATLRELIISNKKIKKCGQCGQWFVAFNGNGKYCRLECKELAKTEMAKKRMQDEIRILLKNRRQVFYNYDNKKELNAFNIKVKGFQKSIKEGESTEKEFIDWIISTYKNGPRPRKKKEA